MRRLLGIEPPPEVRSVNWLATIAVTATLVFGVGYQLPWVEEDRSAAVTAAQQDDGPIASPDSFDWHTRVTDHFEIHYYPTLEADLDRVEAAAEGSYEMLSAELAYNLLQRVPLVLYKERSEFAQQEIAPGATENEYVNSFSEPKRNRIVLLVENADLVTHLVPHELTHIFMFHIVPRDDGERKVPIWIDEGVADYMTGLWKPDDLPRLRQMSPTTRCRT